MTAQPRFESAPRPLLRALAIVTLLAAACAEPSEATPETQPHPGASAPIDGGSPPVAVRIAPVRVVRNPYADVDFEHDLRLMSQFHEHVRDKPELIGALDVAGYNAVGLMHYSGVASKDYTWKERHWPPEAFLPPEFLSSMRSIQLLFPNAEEVGFDHITSPFLTTYIAKWEPAAYPRRERWHYGSTQEAIDLIRSLGGLPFIAHPWSNAESYAGLSGIAGMEIYNAYCRHKFEVKAASSDKNGKLMRSWDRVLRDHPEVVGVAVNDWFGAASDDPELLPATRDSGKAIVLAHEVSLASFRDAIERGAVLAVMDLGEVKGGFPGLDAIRVRDDEIEITTGEDVDVRWVADGELLPAHARTLPLHDVPRGAPYVRAELVGQAGSTVYTQAFALGWD